MATADDQAAKDAADKAAADKAAADAAAGGDGKSYKSQEDFDKALEARLARERKKIEKDFDDKLSAAQTEAQRLASLNDDEKATEEQRKKAEADAKRERDLTLREMRLEARDQLIEKGMPDTLVDLVVDTDADQVKENIDNLSKAFNSAVEKTVEEKLKGKTPEKPNGGNGGAADGKRTGTVAI